MKRPDIDAADIASFLSDSFTDIREIVPVSEGMESKALAFRDGHDEYVLRINRGNEGFLKDAFAYKYFASEHLPIPEIISIGEFDSNFACCVSRRARGRTLQDYPVDELSHVVGPVAAITRGGRYTYQAIGKSLRFRRRRANAARLHPALWRSADCNQRSVRH